MVVCVVDIIIWLLFLCIAVLNPLMYVHTYVCMHICTYVRTYVHTLCIAVRLGHWIRVPKLITFSMCVDGCGCGYTVACTYVCAYVCTYIYSAYIHTHPKGHMYMLWRLFTLLLLYRMSTYMQRHVRMYKYVRIKSCWLLAITNIMYHLSCLHLSHFVGCRQTTKNLSRTNWDGKRSTKKLWQSRFVPS